MRTLKRLLVLATFFLSTTTAMAADSLYAASVRSQVGESAHMIAGNLYSVDLSTAVFTLVGSLRVAGAPVGLTGLAKHPVTDVVYGITATSSPNFPRSLVIVNTAAAEATLVGALGAAGSDIAFDSHGKLFVWLREISQLATIDLRTGKVTPLGAPGTPSPTGGLAIAASGRAYLAAMGATGSLDTVDTTTGAITPGPTLSGAPFPGGINSLTISPGGDLFAVNTNLGAPANTVLVKIEPATGVITQIGPLPNDTDALVFAQREWDSAGFLKSRQGLATLALLGAAVLAMLFLAFRWVRKEKPRV